MRGERRPVVEPCGLMCPKARSGRARRARRGGEERRLSGAGASRAGCCPVVACPPGI